MSKHRTSPLSSQERPSGVSPQRRGQRRAALPAAARVLISLLIVWHLTAVFLAPLSIPPSSWLVVNIAQRRPMQWYLDALYLNHGYQFFAPDPGAGHLIRFEVMDDRGQLIEKGEFPSRKDYWPRLRYHRYFMLADQSELPLPDEQVRRQWQEIYLRAYAQQLMKEYDGTTARVERVIHYPLYRQDALDGLQLDDERTYETVIEVVERRDDLAAGRTGQLRPWNDPRRSAARGWQGGVR